jgi:uncharacterized membrane protein YwzB
MPYHSIRSAHPVLTILLVLLYAVLAWRWWTLQEQKLSPWFKTLHHTARLLLLLLYMDGLMLFMLMRLPVSDWHHYVSLLPVVVIFIFQFLPGVLRRPITARGQSLMCLAMMVSLIIIGLSSSYY